MDEVESAGRRLVWQLSDPAGFPLPYPIRNPLADPREQLI